MTIGSIALNNRELALFVWIAVFFGVALWRIGKKPFVALWKAFFVKQIVVLVILMTLYIVLVALAFRHIGLWDIANLKITLFWAIGVAFIMLMNINDVATNEHYFKDMILNHVKALIVLEFIINFYVFNFFIELLLVPALVLLSMMAIVAENNPAHKTAKKVLETLLAVVGIVLLIFAIYNLAFSLPEITSVNNLRDFLIPTTFTLAFLPFIYVIALYNAYEQIFVRLKIFNRNQNLVRYAMFRILIKFHFRLAELNKWSRRVGVLKIQDKTDITKSLRRLV